MIKNNFLSIWAVVPCFNRTICTLRFLRYFSRQDYPNLQVVIIDDGSTDNTGLNVTFNYPNVHVIHGDGNLWWSGGTNLGVKYALKHGADYILTINDDSEYNEYLVSSLYNIAKLNDNYIVGAVQVEETNKSVIWCVGASMDFQQQRLMKLNFSGDDISILSDLKNPYPVEFNPGNGVLIPISVFHKVGFYDEINLPQYHADSEFLLRASRLGGFKNVVALDSIICNQILTEPLVTNIPDLLFSNKSDLNWRALASLLLRFYPNENIEYCFNKLYDSYLKE